MAELIDGWVADFETTTDENDCRVWLWAACQIIDENVIQYGTDIESFCEFCESTADIVFFHNLAFDGKFILDHVLKNGISWVNEVRKPHEVGTLISDSGKFYRMLIKWDWKNQTIFYDSLKKLPMSVAAISKSFDLEMSKGEIDYAMPREVGYVPTPEEVDYIRRDVGIVAQALCQSISEGMEKMTVASDSMAEYKRVVGTRFKTWFPEVGIECDDVIRRSYRGGFVYKSPNVSGIVGDGIVLDVNSLYPYVMNTAVLPYGYPEYFSGAPSPDDDFPLYIVNLTFTAKLKKNHIPTIQIHNSPFYIPTKYQENIDEPLSLTMTNVDIELMQQQYDVNIISYEGGFKFRGTEGMFSEYIDKWSRIKAESTGGKRAIAKLHLNSLYGKFATNPKVRSKRPVLQDDKISYNMLPEEQRNPIYTAVASFITANARRKTITAAQRHYNRFCYADTDSLHMTGTELPDDLDIHPSRLGAWKHESTFSRAVFIRAKAYAEQLMDGSTSVHVAGMPSSITRELTVDDVAAGGVFSGKLVPKVVPGGVVLINTTFTLE